MDPAGRILLLPIKGRTRKTRRAFPKTGTVERACQCLEMRVLEMEKPTVAVHVWPRIALNMAQ